MSSGRLRGRALFWLLALSTLAGCAGQTEAPISNPLIAALDQAEGHYRWDDSQGRYVLSDKPALGALAERADPERDLAALVHCLDIDTPTRVTLTGRAVSLGQLCYELLGLIAYHEPVDRYGEHNPEWPGYLTPTAGAAERAAAKRAWKAVLDTGTYALQ